jgi:hypothetical protein
VQVLLDISSFPNTKTLKSTMNLAKMLFDNLDTEDFFGLKILKNGFNPNAPQVSSNARGDNSTQPDIQYLEDVIMLESKQMNTTVKQKYLDDFTNDLQAQNKQNRMTTKSAQMRTREMQKQTLAALQHTINKISNIEGYEVAEIDGVKIVGPMKWIILVFGPNHQAKDLKHLLLTEYTDLNVIVLLITNNQSKGAAARTALNQVQKSASGIQPATFMGQDLDPSAANLNKLCRLTPEGYMIVIEQRQFEGREGYLPASNDLNKSQLGNKSLFSQDVSGVTSVHANLRNVLSRDVEKIFGRICQSIELYKTENIPIITEFLEF